MSEVQSKFINRPAWKTEFMTIRKTQVKKKMMRGTKQRYRSQREESKIKRIQYVSDGCLWTEGENKTNQIERSNVMKIKPLTETRSTEQKGLVLYDC